MTAEIVIVAVAGMAITAAVAAYPTIADSMDRRVRRNAAIDLMDQAQKMDFARDTIAGRETPEYQNTPKKEA